LPLFLFFLLILSCGIKAPPKPLPEPVFSVKRIGEFVYVLGNDIKVEGFKKFDGFWYKKEKKALCFKVKHTKGKTKKVCVREAFKEIPKLEVRELKEEVLIIPKEEGVYRVYKVLKDKILYPNPLKEFKKDVKIKKDYEPYYVGITKLISQNYESEPLIIKIPPKPKPAPKPPYAGGYTIKNEKLIIYWFHESYDKIVGFNIYKNGEKLNKKPLKRNYFFDHIPDKDTIYEITAVNRFGMESKPLKIFFHPEALQKP